MSKTMCSLVLTVGVLLAGSAAAQNEIRIGVLQPLSGPIANEGRRQLNGMENMRDIINERGGIHGKKITWAVGDAPDATAASNEAGRLINREGVKLIMGTFSSSLCLPASDVAERNNVIYFEVSCLDTRYSKRGYKNTYRSAADAGGMGHYSIEFIRDSLHKKLGTDLKKLKLAILSEDSAFGQGISGAARKRAEELGIAIVSVDFYNRNTMVDFTPLILKLKKAQPDVLLMPNYTNDAILFWRQARQQDLQLKATLNAGAVGYGSPDFGKTFGKLAEGPFTINQANEVSPKNLSKDGAALEAYVKKRYEEKYKEPYGGSALLGATGVAIMAEILKKTGGDLNPEKFRAAAQSIDIPVGGLVHAWGAKFDASGQNLDERVLFPATQWQDGTQVTVWPERFAVSPMRATPLPRWSERH